MRHGDSAIVSEGRRSAPEINQENQIDSPLTDLLAALVGHEADGEPHAG
jgi:hypothetical protein